MSTAKMTLREIRAKGYAVLLRELGPVGYARFLQDLDAGHGDYTKQRANGMKQASGGDLRRLVAKHRRTRSR